MAWSTSGCTSRCQKPLMKHSFLPDCNALLSRISCNRWQRMCTRFLHSTGGRGKGGSGPLITIEKQASKERSGLGKVVDWFIEGTRVRIDKSFCYDRIVLAYSPPVSHIWRSISLLEHARQKCMWSLTDCEYQFYQIVWFWNKKA